MTVVIGLTGPIGCGKSTVAGWLRARGAVVVDADRIAREVLEPGGPAHDGVVAAFGPRVVGAAGAIDRAALAAIVFADGAELARLEAIVHPAVRPRIEAAVASARDAGAPAVVVEAIKLVEGGYAAACDEVWLITCDPAEQRHRLAARGLTWGDAARRIETQGDLADRLRPAATRIIDTSDSPAASRARVDAAYDATLVERHG